MEMRDSVPIYPPPHLIFNALHLTSFDEVKAVIIGQKYHPTRVLTIVYQPFALVTTAIFTYHEAKVNTRLRNLTGYILFFLCSLCLIMFTNLKYPRVEIDEVRFEWAECMLDYI
ncbi:hypothetical protein ZIOFF_001577 [Zingiber officinale]|uniref:Uncharacterized protein n=1 Tax=Zingiber officinale TaxID=94328 RepID=A0A8J5LS81_ZINOF|nr:hypothetical protein ZIOFF_001577 [Zingiber officinale]